MLVAGWLVIDTYMFYMGCMYEDVSQAVMSCVCDFDPEEKWFGKKATYRHAHARTDTHIGHFSFGSQHWWVVYAHAHTHTHTHVHTCTHTHTQMCIHAHTHTHTHTHTQMCIHAHTHTHTYIGHVTFHSQAWREVVPEACVSDDAPSRDIPEFLIPTNHKVCISFVYMCSMCMCIGAFICCVCVCVYMHVCIYMYAYTYVCICVRTPLRHV